MSRNQWVHSTYGCGGVALQDCVGLASRARDDLQLVHASHAYTPVVSQSKSLLPPELRIGLGRGQVKSVSGNQGLCRRGPPEMASREVGPERSGWRTPKRVSKTNHRSSCNESGCPADKGPGLARLMVSTFPLSCMTVTTTIVVCPWKRHLIWKG